jgi:hypothetical protein
VAAQLEVEERHERDKVPDMERLGRRVDAGVEDGALLEGLCQLRLLRDVRDEPALAQLRQQRRLKLVAAP